MNDSVAFMEHWFREVWWNQSSKAIDDFFVSEGRAEGVGAGPVDHADYKAFHRALLGLVDKVDIQIQESMVDGDRVMAKTMVSAVCRKTAKPVSFGGVVLCTLVPGDGGLRITQAENFFDFMGLFEQLGLLEEGVLERCLSGQAAGARHPPPAAGAGGP